jgi:formylmethanofuran dehydrogenase subunit E
MIQYTDDPVADFLAYDREQTEWEKRLPKCAHCKEPIQDEHYYIIDDKNVCYDCLEDFCNEHCRVSNEAY